MNVRFNAELLREWIKRSGPLGQERLAVKSGLSYPALQRLKTSTRGPDVARLSMLAKAMGVTCDELLIPIKGKRSK